MAATIGEVSNELSQPKSNISGKEKGNVTSATIIQGEGEEEWPSPVIAQKADTAKVEQKPNPRRKSRSKIKF